MIRCRLTTVYLHYVHMLYSKLKVWPFEITLSHKCAYSETMWSSVFQKLWISFLVQKLQAACWLALSAWLRSILIAVQELLNEVFGFPPLGPVFILLPLHTNSIYSTRNKKEAITITLWLYFCPIYLSFISCYFILLCTSILFPGTAFYLYLYVCLPIFFSKFPFPFSIINSLSWTSIALKFPSAGTPPFYSSIFQHSRVLQHVWAQQSQPEGAPSLGVSNTLQSCRKHR